MRILVSVFLLLFCLTSVADASMAFRFFKTLCSQESRGLVEIDIAYLNGYRDIMNHCPASIGKQKKKGKNDSKVNGYAKVVELCGMNKKENDSLGISHWCKVFLNDKSDSSSSDSGSSSHGSSSSSHGSSSSS